MCITVPKLIHWKEINHYEQKLYKLEIIEAHKTILLDTLAFK